MTHFNRLLFFLLILSMQACSSDPTEHQTDQSEDSPLPLPLSEEELANKVKGMLVGSAIGDAMGAPTEMWDRESIDRTYGWVDDLDSMVREVSPEGTWKVNLPAGGTTDDTRWKKLVFEYLETQPTRELDPTAFSRHIVREYEAYFSDFQTLRPEQTEALEYANLRVLWLQEWYKVSKPILNEDLMGYQQALGKFYGGEMVCAGLLYAPAIGLRYPGQPEMAYEQAYRLSLYDIGYAKDISALSAAMTAAAMTANGDKTKLLDVLRSVDPESFFKSRLVGRSSYRILEIAREIAETVHAASAPEKNLPGEASAKNSAMQQAFVLLDKHLQDMPFHAGEIHLQVLTAMLVADFDFRDSLTFLVNYGRDNDTTAAILGGILGAFHGYENLPDAMKTRVVDVNKNLLDIDLHALAETQTNHILSLYAAPK
ncbi:ADP-ribosylglycohydrolase family protein [Cyclobacterium xiamenense]|uniref:ADP-ribosylglycohydrolase family protein n=1 Tax=Cyclobacterium xiamenense TaxID=1297121 RepID=UPI0015752F8B|nr:ADP-ribosylglycohydrolase family protein [Cyclobacterium xiamenense]